MTKPQFNDIIFLLSQKGVKIINTNKNIFKGSILKKFVPLITIILVIIIAAIIIVTKRKTITIMTNGNAKEIVTYKDSVSEVLSSNNIILDSKDKISPPMNSKITNKQTIKIKKAIHIKLVSDGKVLSLKSAEKNIQKLLLAEKVKLHPQDIIVPATDTPLTEGLNIKITRVITTYSTKQRPISFQTTIKVKSSLPNTVHRIIFKGTNGEKKYTYKNIYHDKKLFSKKMIKEAVVKKPRDRIIVQGSYPVMPVSKSGKLLSYYKKLRVRATAYWAVRGIGRTFTGSGRMAIRNPNGYSTIAVDKHLFPYGTKLFIEGYGFAVAADTGTAIIGNTIDVYFNTRQEARGWAVRHPLVYVLK